MKKFIVLLLFVVALVSSPPSFAQDHYVEELATVCSDAMYLKYAIILAIQKDDKAVLSFLNMAVESGICIILNTPIAVYYMYDENELISVVRLPGYPQIFFAPKLAVKKLQKSVPKKFEKKNL